LAAGEDQAEDLLDRLILDVKAVSLLYPTEAELQDRLEERMVRSNDESIRKFVKALQFRGGGGQPGRLLIIAMGDLLLASLLVIAGAVILVPTVVGVNTLQGLVQFFADRSSSGTVGSFLTPYLSFVEFALGAVLVISAFYSLREAASNLQQAGISIKSGES
jgi:hypothetical protein